MSVMQSLMDEMGLTQDEIMEKLKPLKGNIIINKMKKGERRVGKIILRDDNGKVEGVRPRWAQVLHVADDIPDVKEGDWILMEHGRWTRGIDLNSEIDEKNPKYIIHRAEYKGIIAISDEDPEEMETFGKDISSFAPPPSS